MPLWENCDHLHIKYSASPRFPSFTHNVLQSLNLFGVSSGLILECQGPPCAREIKTEHNAADPSQVPKRRGKALPKLMTAPLLLQPHMQLVLAAARP